MVFNVLNYTPTPNTPLPQYGLNGVCYAIASHSPYRSPSGSGKEFYGQVGVKSYITFFVVGPKGERNILRSVGPRKDLYF